MPLHRQEEGGIDRQTQEMQGLANRNRGHPPPSFFAWLLLSPGDAKPTIKEFASSLAVKTCKLSYYCALYIYLIYDVPLMYQHRMHNHRMFCIHANTNTNCLNSRDKNMTFALRCMCRGQLVYLSTLKVSNILENLHSVAKKQFGYNTELPWFIFA